MSKKHKNRVVLKAIIFITLILSINDVQLYNISDEHEELTKNFGNIEELLISQGNDTIAPIITFIQPSLNNSIITTYSYLIIANISDENPPAYGNVTIQISNYTNILFDAYMNNTEGDLWSFNWDNITLYPNQENYILKIWATDSSSNANSNSSLTFYVFINIYSEIPLWNVILYFVVFAAIFFGILYYINKKRLYHLSKAQKE